MDLFQALKILLEKGHLKLLEPQPLPTPLLPRHDPDKYCSYHQQRDHDTIRCIRFRHKIQDLIDEEIIAPPKRPHATTNPSPPHLNLIHTLPSTYNPSTYITPTHLPKPEVFILENTDLCMMDASELQSSQTPKIELSSSLIPVQPTPKSLTQLVHRDQVSSNTLQGPIGKPTTSELLSMIKDLQSTVVDSSFGILAPSLATSHAKNFTAKSFLILG